MGRPFWPILSRDPDFSLLLAGNIPPLRTIFTVEGHTTETTIAAMRTCFLFEKDAPLMKPFLYSGYIETQIMLARYKKQIG